MMAEMLIDLRACDPAANRFRAWRLEVGQDLFGAWTAEVRFGRIGRPGRALRRAFASEREVRAFVAARLRRRASAASGVLLAGVGIGTERHKTP